MPRTVLLLVIVLLAVSLLFSCGQKPVENSLTIFSWWTAGGEADGLAALIGLFNQKNPDTKVVNAAVAGGAGTNAKAVLKTRMLGGDAPGSFQVHGGAELILTWVTPKMMAPINSLFDANNWRAAFPKQLIEMVSDKGQIYAVPANIHRSNLLWYNKAVFAQNDLKAPETFDELVAVCNTLKEKGVTPIALGSRNKWPVLHLFESLLLATAGTETYTALFQNKAPWSDEKVTRALEQLKTLIEFANKDHLALTWDQAAGQVQQGKAGMTVMGDWANGYFKAQKWTPGKDFDAIPVPGTKGYFIVITDTFGLPAKAPNQAASLEFLKVVGSKEGQLAFNLKKGSIPARTDVPLDAFDAISQKTAADFKADTLAPSAAHGSATNEQFVTALNDLLSVFVVEKNVEETQKAMLFAAKDSAL